MTKEEMIRKLVAHSVSTALAEPKHYWLSDLFEKGFTGYRNLSRGQLKAELQMRGLADEEDDEPIKASALEDDLDDYDDLEDLDDLDLDTYRDDGYGDLPMRAGEAD
jgi:hypothetical protein